MVKVFFKFLQFFFIALLILFLFSTPIGASSVYLDEDFNDGLAEGWVESAEMGSWSILNGEYIGTVTLQYPKKPTYSYYPSILQSNYIFEADVKSTSGVDKAVMFRYNSMDETYTVNLRNSFGSGGNDLNLVKVTPGNVQILETKYYQNTSNQWYRLRIIAVDNKFKVFVDNQLIIDYLDNNNPILSGTVGLQVWPGAHTPPGIGNVTTIQYDNILVKSTLASSKTVLLPGMGSCWNGALLKGEDANDWILPPSVHGLYYQDLTDSFENAGLLENEDWYLFCYDWRKNLEYNADKLNEFIENNLNSAGEVNLVGHSMGGLIGRIYAQNHPEKVDRLITFGSPHQGATRAYPAWEAGQFWEYEGITKLLLEILIHTNKSPGEHPMNTVRRTVPSLKEILPTFDFLVHETTGDYKEIGTHQQQNETMTAFNQSLSEPIKNKMGIIYGNGIETLESIKVTSFTPYANWVHQSRGLWEDGEPSHTCPAPLCEYTDHNKDYSSSIIKSPAGDQTVLVKSSTLSGVDSFEIQTNHGDLVKNQAAIQHLFDLLGIADSPAPLSNNFWEKGVAFLVRSPANLTLTAPDGKQAGFELSAPIIENSFYDPLANFLLVPNPLEGEYQIKITGTDNGDYRLLAAKIDDQQEVIMTEYQSSTTEGQTNEFLIDLDQDDFSFKDPDGLLALESTRKKIETMQSEFTFACSRQKIFWPLEKAEKIIERGKFKKASRLIKISFFFFNRCFFKLDNQKALSLFEDYKSIVLELTKAYETTAQNTAQYFSEKKITKNLNLKENSLKRQNQKFQRIVNNGQQVPLFKTVLFEESAKTLAIARESVDEQKLAKADILKIQLGFLLRELRK